MDLSKTFSQSAKRINVRKEDGDPQIFFHNLHTYKIKKKLVMYGKNLGAGFIS